MTEHERLNRQYDFFLTLPTQLQNQLALQRTLAEQNKAPDAPPIPEKYRFSHWYD